MKPWMRESTPTLRFALCAVYKKEVNIMTQRGWKQFFGRVLKTGTESYATSLLLTKNTKAATLRLIEGSQTQRTLCSQHLEERPYSHSLF